MPQLSSSCGLSATNPKPPNAPQRRRPWRPRLLDDSQDIAIIAGIAIIVPCFGLAVIFFSILDNRRRKTQPRTAAFHVMFLRFGDLRVVLTVAQPRRLLVFKLQIGN